MITNYVFGFGSLICSSSRAITGQHGPVFPVIVANLERSWSAHVDFASRPSNAPPSMIGATAVSVAQQEGASCCGILLELLDEDELLRLDEREGGYDRWGQAVVMSSLRSSHVVHKTWTKNLLTFYLSLRSSPLARRVPIPLDDISALSSSSPFPSGLSNPKNKFWCYTGTSKIPATSSHPILQSYVDVIIKGCLEFSPEFASTFVTTTTGWEGFYMDDRGTPIYARAEVGDIDSKSFIPTIPYLTTLCSSSSRPPARMGRKTHTRCRLPPQFFPATFS